MKNNTLSYKEKIKYADKTFAIEGYKLNKSDKKYMTQYAKGLITQEELFAALRIL